MVLTPTLEALLLMMFTALVLVWVELHSLVLELGFISQHVLFSALHSSEVFTNTYRIISSSIVVCKFVAVVVTVVRSCTILVEGVLGFLKCYVFPLSTSVHSVILTCLECCGVLKVK